MTTRRTAKKGTSQARRRARPRPARRGQRRRWLPKASTRRRLWRRLRGLPRSLQLAIGVITLVCTLIVANAIFHVARKPSELFFPVSGSLFKTPRETWRVYASSFRAHSTPVITAEFLAALAQIEGSGNPVARTYWRWSFSTNPLELYRPASSAVGMYQLTDGTFAEARRFCIHDHKVVKDGPWNDFRSCWFNGLYARVIPSHAIELTSAYLDHRVTRTLERRGIARATLAQKQDLAAVIHLCGASAGDAFAARGFKFRAGQRCGDHDPRLYLARVHEMLRLFARLGRAD